MRYQACHVAGDIYSFCLSRNTHKRLDFIIASCLPDQYVYAVKVQTALPLCFSGKQGISGFEVFRNNTDNWCNAPDKLSVLLLAEHSPSHAVQDVATCFDMSAPE